jgi:hypothetical protein
MPCLRAQWESFTADMDDNKKGGSLQPPAPLEGEGVVEKGNRGCLLWLGFRRHALPVHIHAYVREKRPDFYAQELYLVHKIW